MRLRSFWVNSTVSTSAAVTTRHPQCPVVTTVDTEGINTVAVTAKADGRSTTTRQNHLSEGVLTSQRSFATVSVAARRLRWDEI